LNVCQNPGCLALKLDAQWKIIEERAEANGERVMARDKAKTLWPGGVWGGDTAGLYVRQDWKPDYSCTGHLAEEAMETWGEILDGEKVSWIMVQAPKKQGFVRVLEKATAIELAEAKWAREGKVNLFEKKEAVKEDYAVVAPVRSVAPVATVEVPSAECVVPSLEPEGPTREQKEAIFKELVFLKMIETMDFTHTGLWIEFLRSVILGTSMTGLRFFVRNCGIERQVESLNGDQLRAIVVKHYEGALITEICQACVMLGIAHSIVAPWEPAVQSLYGAALEAAAIDLDEIKRAVHAQSQVAALPAPEKKPKKGKSAEYVVPSAESSEPDAAAWLADLIGRPVPVTEANSSGVFPNDTDILIRFRDHHCLGIQMARDELGCWYGRAGWNLPGGVSGSGFTRTDEVYDDRADLIDQCLNALAEAVGRDGAPEDRNLIETVMGAWAVIAQKLDAVEGYLEMHPGATVIDLVQELKLDTATALRLKELCVGGQRPEMGDGRSELGTEAEPGLPAEDRTDPTNPTDPEPVKKPKAAKKKAAKKLKVAAESSEAEVVYHAPDAEADEPVATGEMFPSEVRKQLAEVVKKIKNRKAKKAKN
jgi:hypothetical protein